MSSRSFMERFFNGLRGDRPARSAMSLCRALMGERGEASGAALARDALAAFGALGAAERAQFFDVLALEFSPSAEDVDRAAAAYRLERSTANLQRLQRAAEPARQELFRRINMAPGGTAALIEMRRELLAGLGEHPSWQAIDADLLHLLRSWFNRGFLRLERIDWRTPAIVLEKLIRYESVHAIRGWSDLHRRLEADRRCYAFFHPQLPEEPLIFIEVALTHGVSARVQPLLDAASPVEDPGHSNCAVFYSINNCQDGLRGISFGDLLIKQVAENLRRELPRVRKFVTLSPIPGFRQWLAAERVHLARGPRGEERMALLDALERPGWQDSAAATPLHGLLLPLCAHYLLRAKKGTEPLDAVSRFHLGNGASLERINWLGDTSEHGMAISAGMMVNYVYRLSHVERNHERFVKEHHVEASREVEGLARESPFAAGETEAARA
ncbi:MAG: malonyl-CoA decarboxylase [Betaproteobacteria bacterium]|nr:malonyl-CoA decarboxylase [Betaproteobacteria bacterium]